MMSPSNHEPSEPARPEGVEPMTAEGAVSLEHGIDVEERTPDGGRPDTQDVAAGSGPPPVPELGDAAPEPSETVGPRADDDEPAPELVWYVLKVQSSREDTIRDALQRRVKIQGLEKYFGQIVVPTEKITEIRNNKKRIVERKTDTGYIMVQMELNEKTW